MVEADTSLEYASDTDGLETDREELRPMDKLFVDPIARACLTQAAIRK